jgi:predicted aminopeptidase
LKSRVPIKQVLQEEATSDEVKNKLKLILKVKKFASQRLKLKDSKNYETYVQLDRPYVTWVVRAAPAYQLRPYTWWFPIVGSVPYKGYFSKDGAKEEAKVLKDEGYDIYVRGVSAYSTLGWFHDPVLSSMLRYDEHDLVNLIIHETVHATVFIKGHIDFNERLATFVGNVGTELFYSEQEKGKDVLNKIAAENSDQDLFSAFISEQLKELRKYYKRNKNKISKADKTSRLAQIQNIFSLEVQPKLASGRYNWFTQTALNNAILLSLETYQSDLADFETVYTGLGKDFERLLKFAKDLEIKDNPEKSLRKAAKKFRESESPTQNPSEQPTQ